jgi:hypothetical protein
MLVHVGERLDRHEDCGDSMPINQPGLAHR